jgi:hypothetical protein
MTSKYDLGRVANAERAVSEQMIRLRGLRQARTALDLDVEETSERLGAARATLHRLNVIVKFKENER